MPGVQVFGDFIAANRMSLSMAFQASLGAAREYVRGTAPLVHAKAVENSASAANLVAAARVTVSWQAYTDVHFSIARQGAMYVFNTIDLALKDYGRIQYGPGGDKKWFIGGPVYGSGSILAKGQSAAGGCSLLELVRAICNYFRHWEEWVANGTQSNPNINRLIKAGLSPTAPDAPVQAVLLLGLQTWLDLEKELVDAIALRP